MNVDRREFTKSLLSGAAAAAVARVPAVGAAALAPAIDWLQFCDPDSFRFNLRTPWVRWGWKCACDSRIAIRVGMTGEPETPRPEDGPGRRPPLLKLIDWEVREDEIWLPWPQTPPVYGFGSCAECDGDGYLGPRCPCQQDKDREDFCNRCCKTSGRLGPHCPTCWNARSRTEGRRFAGEGWLPVFHRVGCQCIHVNYNRRIMSLPGPIEFIDRPSAPPIPVGPRPVGERQGAIRFRFALGDGLVMPVLRD